MWFAELTGFQEESPEQVRENLTMSESLLTSRVNGKQYVCGELETPSLAELRERVARSEVKTGKLSVQEVIADVQQLHVDKDNAGSLFQVASQFNLLEMVSSRVTPEQGIDGYEYDLTQGPACAIAAGAGTIYRNYFALVNGRIGQTYDNQLDCLADLGARLGNTDSRLWIMQNGYALASREGLDEINEKLVSASEAELDELRKLLRIGIQWNTEVTLDQARHTVTQAYCSALPVAYSRQPSDLWKKFSQLVLDASYEATLCAGILNSLSTGNNQIYLTLIGGGAFGNDVQWITEAILRALSLYRETDLQVFIVSRGYSNQRVRQLIQEFEDSR